MNRGYSALDSEADRVAATLIVRPAQGSHAPRFLPPAFMATHPPIRDSRQSRLEVVRRLLRVLAQDLAREFGVSASEILGRRRFDRIAIPRHALYWIACDGFGATHKDVGLALGGRRHSAVTHGIRAARDHAHVNSHFDAVVRSLCARYGTARLRGLP